MASPVTVMSDVPLAVGPGVDEAFGFSHMSTKTPPPIDTAAMAIVDASHFFFAPGMRVVV